MSKQRVQKKDSKVRGLIGGERQAVEAGVPLPAMVIRLVRVPQTADGTSVEAPPLLYPHRSAKHWMGRDRLSGITQAILNMLAVYTLVALRMLEVDESTPDPEAVVQAAAGRSLKHLLKRASKKLSALTAFNTGDELIAWAAGPTDAFRMPVAINGAQPLRETALDPVRLLSAALTRTERILRTIHTTQLASDGEVGTALAETFGAGTQLSAFDCYRVALFGDINPAPLWRVHAHAHYAAAFELGRFVGRIDRGAKALLTWHHAQPMEQALAGAAAREDGELTRMYDNVRSSIDAHFGIARFQELLQQSRETGGVVAVDRQTRRLRCRTDIGMKTQATGWRGAR